MTRRLSSVLALSASLILCQALLAAEVREDDPRTWLQRMVSAARTVSFSGELVYAEDAGLDTLRITRLHEETVQRERIISLNGSDLEILRDGRKVIRVFPAERTVMVDQNSGRGGLTDLSLGQIRELESWYTLELAGTDRVAERATQRIDILPHDDHRYGYRLWLDERTGLLLRSQMRNLDGEVLEQFMYVTINFDDVTRSAVNLSQDYSDFQHLHVASAPEPEVRGDWRAVDLPEGFRLLSETWWHMPGISDPVRHLLFGDGLSSVSVYIAPESGTPFNGHSGHGAMQMAGRTMEGYQVTVVGDVPPITVNQVLNGLEYLP